MQEKVQDILNHLNSYDCGKDIGRPSHTGRHQFNSNNMYYRI